MSPLEISPEAFTADYTGTPGARTFYLQCRGATSTYTYVLEKQQVQALAERLRELLLGVDPEDTVMVTSPGRDPVMKLADPPEEMDRLEAIALGYDASSDRVLVVVETGEEEAGPGSEEPNEALHVSLRRDQARAFILHALAIVAEGRDLCQLCGLPIDPSGHDCPARNGHHAGT